MKYLAILREGDSDKYVGPFEMLIFRFVNDGWIIKFALLDKNDKLVLILEAEK